MSKNLLGKEELKYLIQLIKQKIKSVADNKQDSHDEHLQTKSKQIVPAINEIYSIFVESLKRKIVIVDFVELVNANDGEQFKDLSYRMLAGEIYIMVKVGEALFAVSSIDAHDSNHLVWNFCGTDITMAEENPYLVIQAAKLAWYNGKYIHQFENVHFNDIARVHDESLETESKEIVGAINEVNAKVGQGGGSSEKEVVLVDVTELVGSNNIDKFNDLSQQALNGEIAIFVNLEGSVYAVNNIYAYGDSYAWTFIGGDITHAEANPRRSVTIGKLLVHDGVFEPYVEVVNLDKFLKANDESLETESKEIVGAINEVNGQAVKKTDYATKNSPGILQPMSKGLLVDNVGKLYLNGADKNVIAAKNSAEYPLMPSMLDYMFRIGLTTNTETLTDDEKQSARDLIGAVGSTDYATFQKAGVIRLNSDYGTQMVSGALAPLAWDTFIAKRSNAFMSYQLLDKAVKAGLTTNNEILTDEEKTSACDWLGAVTRKPNEKSGWRRVYGMDAYGNEMVHPLGEGAEIYTIPIRGVGGTVGVGTPTQDKHATPKSYVDNLPDNLTLTDEEKTKWVDMIGAMPKPSGTPTGVGVLTCAYSPVSGGYTYGYASMGNSATQIVQYASSSTDMSMMYGNNVTVYVDVPTGNKMAANKLHLSDYPLHLFF